MLAPPLSEIAFEPLPRSSDEHYILRRDGVQMELMLVESVLQAIGNLYLTSLRLIFIPDKLEDLFGGIEIYLATAQLDYNSPIFGTNYISGKIEPGPGGLKVASDFKIYLKDGSSATFGAIFKPLLDIVKQNYQENKRAVIDKKASLPKQNHMSIPYVGINTMAVNSSSDAPIDIAPMPPPLILIRPLLNECLSDPSDPTILYVLQPTFNDDASRRVGGI